MYFDFSHKKIATVGIMGAVLLSLVAFTFAGKHYMFGTTPFFPATGIFIHNAIDSVAYGFSGAGRQLAGVFSAFSGEEEEPERDARAIPVLTYHRITGWSGSAGAGEGTGGEGSNVSLPAFRDQMETLHDAGWKTATLPELKAFINGGTLPEKTFVLTFDDGAKDSFYPVDPILDSLDYSAVNYLIVTGTEREESTYYLSTEEVRRMLDTGRWEIGSHTYDAHHALPLNADGESGVPLANLGWRDGRLETVAEYRSRLEGELLGSQVTLEREFGVDVNTFAFPFGETGENSINFPRAEEVVLAEAKKHYDFAFVQNDRDHYTFNYPGEGFLLHRIHVEPSWSGAELLSKMEGGMPKDLPYEDAIDRDNGWLSAWSAAEVSGGTLSLSAEGSSTSASVILDGTKLWNSYEVEANVAWTSGYALLLVSAEDARTYRSCAYENGRVRVQQTHGGQTTVLAEAEDAGVVARSARVGARVTESSVTCLYDGRVIVSATGLRAQTGGIGFQAWSPSSGTARVSVDYVTVREF